MTSRELMAGAAAVVATNGRIRGDGTMVRDMHQQRVKTPAHSTSPRCVYNLVATVPGEDAFPMASKPAPYPYIGRWVTVDDHVRYELLPNGRYDEARSTRESAYRGRYAVTGSHIDYRDDTGFTADGEFVDADTLHPGGMVLRRLQRT